MKQQFSKIIAVLLFITAFQLSTKNILAVTDTGCGNFFSSTDQHLYNCTCDSGWQNFSYYGRASSCCGWVLNDGSSDRCFSTSDPEIEPPIDITEGLSSETFDALNPLRIAGSPVADQLSTPGGIVTRLLNFLFPLAGLILFALITWGGFEMMISSSDQKGMEAGKNRVTAAIVGFILLFSSYWMAQIVEVIFGITIL